MTDARLDELAERLGHVRARVAAACGASGRDPAEVNVVAVSKTFPASDVLRLASLGVHDFGESYDQEAAAKAGALRSAGVDVRWHFVGRLQRNKCRSVASYSDVVHSVDRVEVAAVLGAAAVRAAREVDALVQVSYDAASDAARGGCPEREVAALADVVAVTPGLRLRGVMTVPPLGADPRAVFDRVAAVGSALRLRHPGADVLSAGMTGDLEHAVAAGATHVRVGTALFGGRPQRG